MARPYSVDLDSPDYTPALRALEWAFSNAKRLGYTLPTGFEMALQLLRDEAKVILFLSSPKGGFFSVVENGEESGEEDFDDFMEMLKRRSERKRKRREDGKRAAETVAAIARATLAPSAAMGPACAECGRLRSKGSAALCRACYQAKSPASAIEARQGQDAAERLDAKHESATRQGDARKAPQ